MTTFINVNSYIQTFSLDISANLQLKYFHMTTLPATKFFLDSCDPLQTVEAITALQKINMTLDGQTTNPSLLVKNPLLMTKLEGGKIDEQELLSFYKQEIQAISKLIPEGSVSIEVYADEQSTKDDLLKQANDFYTWIANANVKFPTTKAGLEAAEEFVNNGGRVNMTLVFSQEQALAVHLATKNMKNPGDVLLSPFVGRFDDIGLNGTDFIANVVQMYNELGSQVSILSASLRNLSHLEKCIELGSTLTTGPLNIYQEYVEKQLKTKSEKAEVGELPLAKGLAAQADWGYKTDATPTLQPIPYKTLDLTETNWQNLNIQHDLTDKGLAKFVADWKSVLL
jgi:transaldolase